MDGIVVGVDRSPAGAAALDWALREAAARRVPLVAVRAWTIPAAGLAYPVGDNVVEIAEDEERAARDLVREMLEEACARVPGAGAVDVRTAVRQGAAAHLLLESADGATLLVVGSRGAGPLARALLGSVSSSLLHHATCPVAVLPGTAGAGAPARLVVGVDHSPESSVALAWAVEAARLHGAVLVPVVVRSEEPVVPLGPDVDAFAMPELEASEEQSLLTAASRAGADEGPAVPVDPQVLTGRPSRALLEVVQEGDVLVLGSRGRGGTAALLLGSTSTRCTRHATGAVVVVRGRP